MKPDKIYVEVTSTLDAVAPFKQEGVFLEKIKNENSSGSANSSFSNPSYSHVCPLPPISSLSSGNLQPCAADTPYGPVNQGEGERADQNKEEERRKEMEIIQMLHKASEGNVTMQVSSDYEKVEKQGERMRLQSLDSGMCSGEEVSQESLEPDSSTVTDSHDEQPEDKQEEEEREKDKKRYFKELFGGFGKGSIQICSDYERVQKPQTDTSELSSLDSGINSGGEEQVSQEESLEDVDKSTESTSFLLPSSPSFPLPPPVPSFPELPLKFFGLGLSPALHPLLERNLLMSTSRSVEPSGDGYMPVKQEQP